MAATLLIAALALCQPTGHAGALQPYPLPIGLTVSFPSKPEPMVSAKGDDRKAFSSETDSALFFASDSPVSKEEQKALPPDQEIAAYVFGLLEDQPDRHVVRYEDVLLDGWPGIEYQIDDKKEGATTWSRCYVMDGHIIEVGTLYSTADGAPEAAPEFLASVKQTGTPKCGSLTTTSFSFTRLEPDQISFGLDFPGEAKDDPLDLSKEEFKMILHRFAYARDMRSFDFEYLDLPDGAADDLTADDVVDIRQKAFDAVLKNVDGEQDSSGIEQRDGNDWLTGKFHIKNQGYGRVDVLYYKGRVYTLIAIGPESWTDTPDFKRFFDSVEVKS